MFWIHDPNVCVDLRGRMLLSHWNYIWMQLDTLGYDCLEPWVQWKALVGHGWLVAKRLKEVKLMVGTWVHLKVKELASARQVSYKGRMLQKC